MSTAIETDSLCYRPGKGFELDHLTISVPSGAVYGFLGPNGSGKTTTIKLLLGLLRGSSGSISVLGKTIPKDSHIALGNIGYVPEAPHLYASLRVDQAMHYHQGFYESWDHDLAASLLDRFSLRPRQRLGSLSKGELRKVMILLSLAHRPRLLVLDEPTDGLDPVIRRDILDALRENVNHGDCTVFLSSHLVHELETICDWIAVVDQGRLVTEVPMTTFRNEIKILEFDHAPTSVADPPFEILRQTKAVDGTAEQWVVRGWQAGMESFVGGRGGSLRDVIDVDLENGFVELLRSFRRRDA